MLMLKSTKDQKQEQRIVDAIRDWCKMADELELDMLTLCRIRDTYFPVVNTKRVVDPAALAHAIRLSEAHVVRMKRLLFEVFGIRLEEAAMPPASLKKDYPAVPDVPDDIPRRSKNRQRAAQVLYDIIDASRKTMSGPLKGCIKNALAAVAAGSKGKDVPEAARARKIMIKYLNLKLYTQKDINLVLPE